MVKAVYKGYDTISVYGLTQYDYGQILLFEGIEIKEGTEVHFCQADKAITEYVKENQVHIPDYMLQYADIINTYVYVIDDKSGETVRKAIIYITPREKPADYTTPEEPSYTRLLPLGGLDGQIPVKQPEEEYVVSWGYRADSIDYDGEYVQLMSGSVPVGERVRIMKEEREIELSNDGTNIKWRYTDSNEWHVLVSVENLRGEQGPPGITPEFEIRNGHLFVKYEKEGEL